MNFNRIEEHLRALKKSPHGELPVVRIATALGHEIPWFRADQLAHFSTTVARYDSLPELNDDDLPVGRGLFALRAISEGVRGRLEEIGHRGLSRSAVERKADELVESVHRLVEESAKGRIPSLEVLGDGICDSVVSRATVVLERIRRELAAAIASRLAPSGRVVAQPMLELVTAICEQSRHLSSESVAIRSLRSPEMVETLQELYRHETHTEPYTRRVRGLGSDQEAYRQRIRSLIAHGFVELYFDNAEAGDAEYRLTETGRAAAGFLLGSSPESGATESKKIARPSAAPSGQLI